MLKELKMKKNAFAKNSFSPCKKFVLISTPSANKIAT